MSAGEVVVEYEPQTRIEGDIQQMGAEFSVTELWKVLAGQPPGRTKGTQVIIFDSVGFALEDYCALTFMLDTASELGIGEAVELIPATENPKDPFDVLQIKRANVRHEATPA